MLLRRECFFFLLVFGLFFLVLFFVLVFEVSFDMFREFFVFEFFVLLGVLKLNGFENRVVMGFLVILGFRVGFVIFGEILLDLFEENKNLVSLIFSLSMYFKNGFKRC